MPWRRDDANYKRAKSEGFVARSVYKLEEIDGRFGVLRPGQRVTLMGVGMVNGGDYIVSTVNHIFEAGRYVQAFQLEREGQGLSIAAMTRSYGL